MKAGEQVRKRRVRMRMRRRRRNSENEKANRIELRIKRSSLVVSCETSITMKEELRQRLEW